MMFEYNRKFWKNTPETPIMAEDLNNIEQWIDNVSKNIFDAIYPIGCIYMSANPTNPSELFGGTWEAWGSGRVPVGVDVEQEEFAKAEQTGGEKTHTLTINEMPTHNHTMYLQGGSASRTIATTTWSTSAEERGTKGAVIDYSGGNQAHNILQPYITCYMWKRTS